MTYFLSRKMFFDDFLQFNEHERYEFIVLNSLKIILIHTA